MKSRTGRSLSHAIPRAVNKGKRGPVARKLGTDLSIAVLRLKVKEVPRTARTKDATEAASATTAAESYESYESYESDERDESD